MPYEPFLESAEDAALRHRAARAPLRRELRAGLPPPDDAAAARARRACRSTSSASTSPATSPSASRRRASASRASRALCPRWNVHSAFMTPGIIRTQVSRMPDGTTYFCVARTSADARRLRRAAPAARDLARLRGRAHARTSSTPTASTSTTRAPPCRSASPAGCASALDCEQRAFPAIAPPARHRRERPGRLLLRPGAALASAAAEPAVPHLDHPVRARGPRRRSASRAAASRRARAGSRRAARSTCSPLRLSRLPVGSSASSSRAPVTSARAIATRCISPPESS